LHTLDAVETINRIIAIFPPPEQKQIRLQLAAVLRAVISQRLVRRCDGDGRVPGGTQAEGGRRPPALRAPIPF